MNNILLAFAILGAGAGGFLTTRQSASQFQREAQGLREAWLAQTQQVAAAQSEQANLTERVRELKQTLAQTPGVVENALWSALQTNRANQLAPEMRERLMEELGFNWKASTDYIVVSKETIRRLQMDIINEWKGELTKTATTVFALTPEERSQFEAAMQRARMDFKEWALAHVERTGPKDDVLVKYSLPTDRVMSQTLSNNFFTALVAALGLERAQLTMFPSAYNWMCQLGILDCTPLPATILVRRQVDGRLKASWGGFPPSDLTKGASFPRGGLRSVFPNGWADVAEREGFELPPAPKKK